MHRGYIKIWRKLEDSGLLQMHETLATMIFLILHATHKDVKRGTKYGVVDLKRGQGIFALRTLAKDMQLSVQSIRTILVRLEKMEILTLNPTHAFSVYTIVNYNKYNDVPEQSTREATNEQRAANTLPTQEQALKHLSIKELKPLSAKPDVIEILEYLNSKAGRSYKPVEANSKFILSRLNEGATVDDMKRVIDAKVSEWLNDAAMNKYLRPATLFNAEKFAQYSGETSKSLPVGKFDINEWMKTK